MFFSHLNSYLNTSRCCVYFLTVTQLHCSTFSKRSRLLRSVKNVNAGDFFSDKTAAANSCQMCVVRFRRKCFVRLKPSGRCWSFTVQCFIMLRTLFTLIVLQLIKASLWIWGGSPMPRQSEALSYVPDTTCHSVSALYQLTGLNLSH